MGFPPRRLLKHEEAVGLRIEIARARLEYSPMLAAMQTSLPRKLRRE